MKKNILIIGADSFIASIFIKSLVDKNNIIGYSRKNINYCDCVLSEDFFDINFSHFKSSEIVINFAAIVHQPGLKDDKLYAKVNTELPIHLAHEAKKAGVQHFIQMSTIAVYGDVNNININTTENPTNVYGATKLAADKALLTLQDESFKVSIIRPPMVYGNGNAPGNMMKLIKFALKGFPLPFKGVNNARDFIHIKNLIQALKIAVDKQIYGVLIPTDKTPVSTEEIINFIRKYSSTKVRQIKVPKIFLHYSKKFFPSSYKKLFDSLLVECNLDDSIYSPKYKIDDGIKEMLGYIYAEKNKQ